MPEYNFWADLLDTFQSSPGWVQVVWLLAPPGLVLGLVALILRFLAVTSGTPTAGDALCSIHRDGAGRLHVWCAKGELGTIPIAGEQTPPQPALPPPADRSFVGEARDR